MKKLFIFTLFILTFSLISHIRSQCTLIRSFGFPPDGNLPYGDPYFDGTFIYGTTSWGGANNDGTLFKIKPDGTGYQILLNFASATNGEKPWGALISDGTYLYGTTARGGANGMGTIFKILPDGTGYINLLNFSGSPNGEDPYGSLIYDGTYLYGMASAGGLYDMGTIFKIKTDGTGFSKLLDFSGIANGRYPRGDLMSNGTFLYGMTNGGGANNFGTIFKIMPDGTGFIKLMDLNSASGTNPFGSLITDGTYLYGMAENGGTFNHGTLFRILPDGSGFSVLKDFYYPTIGAHPKGTPTIHNGYLYALITEGGVNGAGSIIRCYPDGSGFTTLMDFSGSGCGSQPWCRPIFDGNTFYAFTATSDCGTIFKFDDANAGIADNEFQTNMNVYPNPFQTNFVIESFKSIDNGTFNLFDISGKLVITVDGLSGNKWNVLRNDLSSGMYFYSLIEKDKIIGKGKLTAE